LGLTEIDVLRLTTLEFKQDRDPLMGDSFGSPLSREETLLAKFHVMTNF
jgi:hypothetical protein